MVTKNKQRYLTYIRKNILKAKNDKNIQRRLLYKDKVVNPSRRYNSCKYICTQYWNTQMYKAKTEPKGEINSNTIIVGDLNTLLSTMERSFR